MKIKSRTKRVIASLLAAFTLFSSAAAAVAAKSEADTSAPIKERPATTGVFAEYFKGTAQETLVGFESHEIIDFAYAQGSEAYSGTGATHYSIRFSGQILAPQSGQYIFTTNADDGAVFSVAGETVITDAGPHYAEKHSGTVTLEEGKYYPFTLDYYNGELGGEIELYWQIPGEASVLVPKSALFLPSYYAAVSLSESGDQVTASATPVAFSENGKLVIECMSGGKLTKQEETALEKDKVTSCTVSGVKQGDFIRAYVVNSDNDLVSELTAKYFGIDYQVTLNPSEVVGKASELLIGACMEDVNHELYGGIWSQMIFGERFAEPAPTPTLTEFDICDDRFSTVIKDGKTALKVERLDYGGPKLTIKNTESESGTATAEMYFDGEGPIGFIIKASDLVPGPDSFVGYEVGMGNGVVNIAKHEYNYTPLASAPCDVKANTWVTVSVKYTADTITVSVNGTEVVSYTDPNPINSGSIGLRAWNANGYFRNIKVKVGDNAERTVNYDSPSASAVSKCWELSVSDGVKALATIDKDNLFGGQQTQKLTYTSGSGDLVLSNSGLNGMGMSFVEGKNYEGYIYASAKENTEIKVSLTSSDGSKTYGSAKINVKAGGFEKYSFDITSLETDADGKFAITLSSPGEINLGYAFLQPGEWGRYEGLQVRKDVVEAMENVGFNVLRFGGLMANAEGYRWKEMLGAPEERSTYNGWWYEQSSFGFGIVEFMELCEAMGIAYIPNFNQYESPEDMADFIRFALGTDESDEWVQKRIEMGHPEPFKLEMIQIGNEEVVDGGFAKRFNAIADAIKEVSTDVILIVGDFMYYDVISDPYNFTGATSGITNLLPHKTMLDNAVENGQTVWFDIHWWTETGNQPDAQISAAISLYKALKTISPESDPKLCVFELNANTHNLERAICNAISINAALCTDIFPIICSANCLQVDKQNDNGWNQGLIFMNSSSVWLQPPALAAKLIGDNMQANRVSFEASGSGDMSFSATASEDGKTISVTVVNRDKTTRTVVLDGIKAEKMTVTSLSGELSAVNTAAQPENITIGDEITCENGVAVIPASSVSVIKISIADEETPDSGSDDSTHEITNESSGSSGASPDSSDFTSAAVLTVACVAVAAGVTVFVAKKRRNN